jgi:serine/threonine protein kinase
VPSQTTFQETELDQLRREGRVLTLLSEKKCDFSARFLELGPGFHISTKMCWYIMERLKGESMDTVIQTNRGTGAEASKHLQGQSGPGANAVTAAECTNAALDVLSALADVHAEGILHLNIQPANIIRCQASEEDEGREFTYKLIGFGTALDSDDTAAKEAVSRSAGTLAIGAGVPPYMSPEMFKSPGDATYPADIWSLGITMFVLLSQTLPFQADNGRNWKTVISENMTEKAPNVLDRIDADGRTALNCSLATVIAKALEKREVDRYSSANEMHGAAFGCLVTHCNTAYSVYLSYRGESDRPLAKLLFDELNHSKTPGGHRVNVYLDTFGGHVEGADSDWDEDIARGLLHSTVYCPILSYGATAPWAQLPEGERAKLVAMGWEEAPLGLERLSGAETDRKDALLKELLIANALLERSSESNALLDGERGQPRAAFPVYAGRQLPLGHPEYPHMGSFFDVEGGGGIFSTLPSPSNSQVAARFLRDRAGLPVEAVKEVENSDRSVASVVDGLSRLQGCCLWDHAGDLAEAALTKEQMALVGKGYAGPPVGLEDNHLSKEKVFPQPFAPSCP